MGCGTNSLKEEVSFPKNLSMRLPIKLEPNREMLTRYSTKSYTYETMQLTILDYRDKSELMALDLMFIESIFPDIIEACRERSVESNCTLPEKTLIVKLSRPNLRALKKAYGHLEFTWDVNSSLPLGEVSYREYDESNKTQYLLNVDLLPMYNALMGKAYESFYYGDSLLKRFQSLQWSEGSETVELTSIKESNSSSSKLTLEYLRDNNQEMVQAYQETVSSAYGESKSHEMFTFMKLNDANNSYVFRYNDAYSSESYNSVNSAYAKFSDNIGFHVKNSGSDNSQLITFFDNHGNELGMYGCYEYEECTLEDKSSWGQGGESEQNASLLDKEFNVKFYNLRADSTTLKDGYYLLFPNSSEVMALASQNGGAKAPLPNFENLQSSVGFIFVFNEKLYGALYDETYREELENFQIIKVIEDGKTQTIYDEVLQKDYPRLRIETEVLR
jgi:hypothetical protein